MKVRVKFSEVFRRERERIFKFKWDLKRARVRRLNLHAETWPRRLIGCANCFNPAVSRYRSVPDSRSPNTAEFPSGRAQLSGLSARMHRFFSRALHRWDAAPPAVASPCVWVCQHLLLFYFLSAPIPQPSSSGRVKMLSKTLATRDIGSLSSLT